MKYNKHSACGLVNQNPFYRSISVIIVWLTGLFFGFFAASRAAGIIPLMLCPIPTDQAPIIGMLLLITAPFTISAFLERYCTHLLILTIIFLKAVFYSFCLSALMIAFHDAGWLAKCLLMFSSSCSAVLLLLFWLESARNCCVNKSHLLLHIIISAFLVIIDYYVISPFAVVFY